MTTSLIEKARSAAAMPASLGVYERLRDEGRRAAETGRLEEALALFERALEACRDAGDPNRIDVATCNRSAVLISLGQCREVMPPLRKILVKNRDPEICSIAAYNLSRAHESAKEYKKGLFYGRIARDRALAAKLDEWLVGSYNQIGNCLMSDSFFREAAKEYRRALGLLAREPSVLRALVTVNLGYCQMMQDRIRDGMRLAFRSLRWFRRFGARVYEVWPHLDLCYAYLELGDLRRAWTHGQRALRLAERNGEERMIKPALFLIGETERAAGDRVAARAVFTELQERFYPDAPETVEVMCTVGMRRVVNLRAA